MSGRKSRDGYGVQFTAPAGGVSEGVFYQIDGVFGLCTLDADEGYLSALETGPFHYETDQIDVADTFAKGDRVYWDNANSRLTTEAAAGLPIVGVVTTAKDSDNVIEFIRLVEELYAIVFTQMALQADSTATDVAGIVSDFNDLLAALQTAGLMASS